MCKFTLIISVNKLKLWTVADQTITLNVIVDIDNCPPGYSNPTPNGLGQCICVQNQPFMICLNSCFSRSNDIHLKEGWFTTYNEVNNDVYVATQQLCLLVLLEGHNNKDRSIT